MKSRLALALLLAAASGSALAQPATPPSPVQVPPSVVALRDSALKDDYAWDIV